jgi:hypothetical protein
MLSVVRRRAFVAPAVAALFAGAAFVGACAPTTPPATPVPPLASEPVTVPASPAPAEDVSTEPQPVSAPPRESVAPSGAVILVVIDGVRWQEIFQGPEIGLARRQWMLGKLPKVADMLPVMYKRFFAGGVAIGGKGAGFTASGPAFVSLPGYLEIMTGHPTVGCTTNQCEATTEPTLADEVRSLPDTKLEDVAVISSWEVIDRAASRDGSRIVVSAGRHGGVNRHKVRVNDAAKRAFDEGEQSVPFPGGYDYRPDRFTAPIALAYVAEQKPRFLFVGLGDTDEYGHGNDYPRYLESLGFADTFLGSLFETLDGLGEYGKNATVFVTSDHGRAKDFRNHGKAPESGRTWLLAAGAGIPVRGSLSLPNVRRLADIAPTIRVLLGLPGVDGESAGQPLGMMLQAPFDRGPTASLF